MNATIAAHDIRTYDCAWPGCPREARRPGGYCDQGHVGSPPSSTSTALNLAPGSLAHLVDDPEPEPAKESPTVTACKIPGCTNNARSTSGPWKNLCADHVSAEVSRRHAARKQTVKPPPEKGQTKAPKPGPVAASGGQAEETLVELARRVTVAKQELAYARAQHDEAVEALRHALDAAA